MRRGPAASLRAVGAGWADYCWAAGRVLECDVGTGRWPLKRNKSVALAVLVVGIMVLLLSAMADVLGLGGSRLVFGYKQLAGATLGSALVIAGAVLYWWSRRRD